MTPDFPKHVADLLREGFGADDIAIKLDCPPDRVRTMIRIFREEGLLARWWPK